MSESAATIRELIAAAQAQDVLLRPHRPRILYSTNPTPVKDGNLKWVNDGGNNGAGSDPDPSGQPKWIQNYPCHDYLKGLGLEPIMLAGDGMLGRSGWWSKDGVVSPPGQPTDLSWGENELIRPSDPPVPKNVHAVADLSLKANTFVPDLPEHLNVMYDLENFSVGIDIENGTPEAWNASLQNILNSLVWFREVNATAELSYWAILPFTAANRQNLEAFWNLPMAKQVVDQLSYVVPWVYDSDEPAITPSLLYEEVYKQVDGIHTYCPGKRIVMSLATHYQIRRNTTDARLIPLIGEAVPSEVFNPIAKLVTKDFRSDAFIFADGELTPQAKANMDYLAFLAG